MSRLQVTCATWACSRCRGAHSQGGCPLGSGSSLEKPLPLCIHLLFILNLGTVLCFLSVIHSPVSSVSPALSIPRLLHRPSFPHGVPNRDINLECPKVFPAGSHAHTRQLFVFCLASPFLVSTSQASLSSLLTSVSPVFVARLPCFQSWERWRKSLLPLKTGKPR